MVAYRSSLVAYKETWTLIGNIDDPFANDVGGITHDIVVNIVPQPQTGIDSVFAPGLQTDTVNSQLYGYRVMMVENPHDDAGIYTPNPSLPQDSTITIHYMQNLLYTAFGNGVIN
jgi:hypothetical protein